MSISSGLGNHHHLNQSQNTSVSSNQPTFLRVNSFSLRQVALWLRPAAATLPCGARVSNCGARASEAAAPGPRAQAQASTSTGLAAPRHVGSSWPRDGACGPCIGRRILSHCTTREAQTCHLEGFLCGNQSSFSRFLLRKGVQSWLSLATQPLRARSVASRKAAGALAPRSPGANKSRVVWGPGKVTDCKEAGLPALRM